VTAASGDDAARGSREGGESRETARARAGLARRLAGLDRAPSRAVQAAFRAVPRHLFVPDLAPAAAYQDRALVIKYDSGGVPVSSSSQPAMMAIMLEQLGLAAGHRVLEIGTGSGYNAAIMARVVGPGGRVVTVDIDPDLVAAAQARLAGAGYGAVQARCGDGGYGDPDGAPFDRVIVTAGAWDIAPAWLDQLAPGGRLVLPLALRGLELSVALERAPGPAAAADGPPGSSAAGTWPDDPHWVGVSAVRCGFVALAGAFAGPETPVPLGSVPGLYVQADDGRAVDAGVLAAALALPAADVGTGIVAASRDELSDLDLWLTLTEPEAPRLSFLATTADSARVAPQLPLGGLAAPAADDGPVGVVGVAHLDEADFPHEITLSGYGPGAPALAARLVRQAAAWARLGRPGAASLSLTVWPASAVLDPASTAGLVVLRRPHVQLAAGWAVPAAPPASRPLPNSDHQVG
jgi:protein-L-isoaspartate(D-aspartate) O-methyltransferase